MRLNEFLAYLRDEPDWMSIGTVDMMTRGVSGDTQTPSALAHAVALGAQPDR